MEFDLQHVTDWDWFDIAMLAYLMIAFYCYGAYNVRHFDGDKEPQTTFSLIRDVLLWPIGVIVRLLK